jgi:hypothetical protein
MSSKIKTFAFFGLVAIFMMSLAWYFFMAKTWVVFDLPDKEVISYKCDHQGQRQIEMYRLEGNAVTNPSIHVSVHLGCDNYEQKSETIIFTADDGSIADNDVHINLVTFDTLAIEYKRGMNTFTKLDKVVFPDSTLNLNIIYKELQ